MALCGEPLQRKMLLHTVCNRLLCDTGDGQPIRKESIVWSSLFHVHQKVKNPWKEPVVFYNNPGKFKNCFIGPLQHMVEI